MNQKLAQGTQLGPYKITRLISKGGMGEVYEAYEEMLNRKVALKIISTQETDGIDAVNLFISEGQALAKINHPNVVTIYRLGLDNNHYYIAMEYVEGLSLNDFTKRQDCSLKEKLDIFTNILNGVQVLHSKNIIHRDLKPKNIIIEADHNAKIVDFGISEIVKENESLRSSIGNKIVGSVFYMSPEAARGEPISFQADIWSLGVILYELVTGEKPFFDITAAGVLKKVRTEKINFGIRSKLLLPLKLKSIILKMCDHSLQLRYKTIAEIIKDTNELKVELFNDNTNITKSVSSYDLHQKATSSTLTASQIASLSDLTEVIPAYQTSPTNHLHKKSRKLQAYLLTIGFVGLFFSTYVYRDQILLEYSSLGLQQQAGSQSEVANAKVSSASIAEEASEPPKQLPLNSQPATEGARLVQTEADLTNFGLARVEILQQEKELTLQWGKMYRSRGPASDQKNISNFPSFQWKAINDVKAYQFELSSDSEFKQLVESHTVLENSFTWKQPAPGVFFWRVRPISDNIDTPYSVAGNIAIKLPSPSFKKKSYKVAKNLPLASANKPTTISLNWNTIPLASFYNLKVSTNKNMSRTILDSTIANTKSTVTLPKNGRYYATVTAMDANRSPASLPSPTTPIEIRNRVNINKPKLMIPDNGTTVPTQGTMITPIIFSWSSVGANSYQIQISNSSDFDRLIFEAKANEEKYLFTQPLPKGRIFWRVRGVSGKEKSSWSSANYLEIQ